MHNEISIEAGYMCFKQTMFSIEICLVQIICVEISFCFAHMAFLLLYVDFD